MKMLIFTAIAVFTFGSSLFAQTGETIVKYRSKKVVEMSNMLGEVEMMTCKKDARPISGTILKRTFDADEVFIESIVLRDARDNRKFININQSQISSLGREAPAKLSTLLAKGKRVQVWSYTCSGGGSGLFIYADRVKVL